MLQRVKYLEKFVTLSIDRFPTRSSWKAEKRPFLIVLRLKPRKSWSNATARRQCLPRALILSFFHLKKSSFEKMQKKNGTSRVVLGWKSTSDPAVDQFWRYPYFRLSPMPRSVSFGKKSHLRMGAVEPFIRRTQHYFEWVRFFLVASIQEDLKIVRVGCCCFPRQSVSR